MYTKRNIYSVIQQDVAIMGVTHTKHNTINTSFISVFDDSNLKSNCENINSETITAQYLRQDL